VKRIKSTKSKHFVVVCATSGGINSANLWGSELQRIHCSTQPTMKYTELVRFILTKFSFFYLFEVR